MKVSCGAGIQFFHPQRFACKTYHTPKDISRGRAAYRAATAAYRATFGVPEKTYFLGVLWHIALGKQHITRRKATSASMREGWIFLKKSTHPMLNASVLFENCVQEGQGVPVSYLPSLERVFASCSIKAVSCSLRV